MAAEWEGSLSRVAPEVACRHRQTGRIARPPRTYSGKKHITSPCRVEPRFSQGQPLYRSATEVSCNSAFSTALSMKSRQFFRRRFRLRPHHRLAITACQSSSRQAAVCGDRTPERAPPACPSDAPECALGRKRRAVPGDWALPCSNVQLTTARRRTRLYSLLLGDLWAVRLNRPSRLRFPHAPSPRSPPSKPDRRLEPIPASSRGSEISSLPRPRFAPRINSSVFPLNW